MEILSTWKNQKYPNKTAQIKKTDSGEIQIFMDYAIGIHFESWIDYEKALYEDGWRKVPSN